MATRGETVINELLTKVGLLGVVEATTAAQAYDKTLDGVSVSADNMTKAQLSTERSLTGLVAKYSEVSRAAADLAKVQNLVTRSQQQGTGTDEQRTIALAGATERLTTALQKQAALKGTLGDTLTAGGAAAAGASKNFGLASHQVQNLGFQLNDLIVQIGSGQGIFRPLLQQGAQVQQILSMSEGGVGGVLSRIGGALGRLGPLGIATFGTVGLAGAAGAAAVALKGYNEELERTQAGVRAFNPSRANDIIAAAQQATANTAVSATDGVLKLTEAYTNFGAAVGVTNIEKTTENFVKLGLASGGTAKSVDDASAAFAKLLTQGQMTSGQLVDFANQFPQFAGAIADAFNVPVERLKFLDQNIPVTGVALTDAINRMGAAAQANIQPWDGMVKSVTEAVLSLDKLLGLSSGLITFLNNTANEVRKLEAAWEAVKAVVEWYRVNVFNLPAAPAAPSSSSAAGGGGSTAPEPPGRRPTTYADMVNARDGGSSQTLGSIAGATRDTAGATRDTAGATADTATASRQNLTDGERRMQEIHAGNVARDAAERAALDNAEHRDEGIWGIYKNAEQTAANTQRLIEITASESRRTPYARTSMESSFGSLEQANASSFGSLEQMNNPPNVGMGRPGQGATTAGSFTATVDTPGPFGDYARWVAAGGIAPMSGGGFPGKDAVLAQYANQMAADAKAAAEMPDKIAGAIQKLDLGTVGQPIQAQIDVLRNLQQTALQRPYKPDPYADKNPEFFYNGEKIFREGQDKVFNGLQSQIAKLQELQSSLLTLVSQGNALPQTLVNALVSAGFGNVAQQVITAVQSAQPPPSATPAPTAVQGASMATPKVWDSWQVGMKTL
jgi:tape measure domain-containing protein